MADEEKDKVEDMEEGVEKEQSAEIAPDVSYPEKISSIDKNMTEGVIWKQIFAFALPILLSNIIQRLYNAVDSIVVGRYLGYEALAAVGSNNSIINVLVSLFLGLSVGAGVVVAQFYGGRRDEDVRKSVQTCAVLAIACIAVITPLGYFLSGPILRLVNTPDEVMSLSQIYLQIYFLGMVGTVTYNMGSGVLMAVGDSKSPFLFLLAACLLNVVLDIAFVGYTNLGVAGAAWATLISQCVSGLCVFLRLYLSKKVYKLSFKNFKPNMAIMKKIFTVGVPAGLQTSMYSVGNLLVQSQLNTFGAVSMAGWVAASKVDDFTYAPIASYGMAMNSFVGQNVGAGRYDRVKKGFWTAQLMSLITAVVIIIPVVLLRRQIVGIFSSQEDVIAVGSEMITFIVPFYAIFCICEVFSGTLKGLGKSLTAFFITFVGILVVRIVWLYTAVIMTHDLKILFLIYPVSWTITALIYIIYLAVRKWDGVFGAYKIPRCKKQKNQ